MSQMCVRVNSLLWVNLPPSEMFRNTAFFFFLRHRLKVTSYFTKNTKELDWRLHIFACLSVCSLLIYRTGQAYTSRRWTCYMNLILCLSLASVIQNLLSLKSLMILKKKIIDSLRAGLTMVSVVKEQKLPRWKQTCDSVDETCGNIQPATLETGPHECSTPSLYCANM